MDEERVKIKPQARILKAEDALVQELEHEAVLLNLENNQYYRLDEDSLRMFQVLTSSASLAEAQTRLLGEYAVPADALLQDLVNFVNELARAGLVRVVDEPLE